MKIAVFVLSLLLCTVAACNRDPNVAKKKYVENGNKYFEKEKYKEALIMYRNALKRDARYGEAYYRAALTELKLNQYTGAVRDLQRAVELQPENLDAHVRLANTLMNAYMGGQRSSAVVNELKSLSDRIVQRFPNTYDAERIPGYLAVFDRDAKTAVGYFEKANQLKPYQPDLVLAYFQTLIALNREEDAEKLAYDLLKKEPSALTMYDALFLQYVRTNRMPDAERILKSKLENNPKNPDPYLQLAAHYYSLKRQPEMQATLNRLTANPSDFPQGELGVGDFFLRIRDYESAMTHYEEGVKKDSKEKSAYQKRMIEVLVKQNKKDEAKQLVTEMLKSDPADPEAIAIRASLSLLTGSKEELQAAITDLQGVIAKTPKNHVVRYNLGKALLAKGDLPAARAQFEEAMKLRPDYILPRLTLAQIHLQNREFGKANQFAQEILNQNPGDVTARLVRSRALVGMGQGAQARTELTQTATQFPNMAEVKLQLAALDLQEKKFKSAEEAFRTLFAQNQDPRALMGLVETYTGQGNITQAVQLLRSELAKNPNRTEYRVALGNVSVTAKDYPAAIAEYKQVLDKIPQSADVWLRLGETYRRSGDLQNAATSFKKGQEFAPKNVVGYLQLALLYDTSGQRNEARPLYERILQMEPDHPVALNNLAFMLADTGADLDKALTMAQRAKQQYPSDGNIADTLGWIYIKKNLSDSAIAVFRDLIKTEPDRATFRYHFAVALYQKGDKDSAKKELEAALRSKPSKDEEAKIRDLMAKLG